MIYGMAMVDFKEGKSIKCGRTRRRTYFCGIIDDCSRFFELSSRLQWHQLDIRLPVSRLMSDEDGVQTASLEDLDGFQSGPAGSRGDQNCSNAPLLGCFESDPKGLLGMLLPGFLEVDGSFFETHIIPPMEYEVVVSQRIKRFRSS